jgi:arginyl-tRNA synthetase
MIRDQLRSLVEEALEALRKESVLSDDLEVAVEITRPDRPEHGDFTTNVALELASRLKMPPRAAADAIIYRLPPSDSVAKVEVAGPGFINFHLARRWLYETVVEIATKKDAYGRSQIGEGVRVQVEFGSANPTGPIHVGTARNIAYGDALASVLEAAGYSVERENYLNDTGGQVERFTRSLEARYLQALGRDAEVPEDGYKGDYLIELGKELAKAEGMGFIDKPGEIRKWGLAKMVESQKRTLERFGVKHDNWFMESTLHESSKVQTAVDKLRAAGHIHESEGALWFRSVDFGAKQDQVIVRSDEKGGHPTYFAGDAAYLLDKLERGFDHLIYFWGADHHGYASQMMALARALGVQDHVEIIIYQLVNFGQRMSRRSGEFISLDELLDEVGVDAARFTFVSRSPDSSFDFDFDLVKSQSQENPVYYVQYAHTRPAALLRYARERGIDLVPVEEAPLQELAHESELDLIRKLGEFPEVVELAARLRAPYRLTHYARAVAEAFHYFYRHCRVIGEDPGLTQARLWLSEAARQVLANSLAILGVSAPERM